MTVKPAKPVPWRGLGRRKVLSDILHHSHPLGHKEFRGAGLALSLSHLVEILRVLGFAFFPVNFLTGRGFR